MKNARLISIKTNHKIACRFYTIRLHSHIYFEYGTRNVANHLVILNRLYFLNVDYWVKRIGDVLFNIVLELNEGIV